VNLESITNLRSLPEQADIPRRYQYGLQVSDGGVIIAAGFIRITSEAILVMNRSVALPQRVEAVRQLIGAGIQESQSLGLTDMHVFTNGRMARLLRNKYGFVDRENALVLNL
jgi:hypothetical protein